MTRLHRHTEHWSPYYASAQDSVWQGYTDTQNTGLCTMHQPRTVYGKVTPTHRTLVFVLCISPGQCMARLHRHTEHWSLYYALAQDSVWQGYTDTQNTGLRTMH
ncbi:hypothetical protein FKM82_004988 [Ascaphus truei]